MYKVRERDDGKFEVINVETETVKAVKDTREEAESLVRALEGLGEDE
jgi:hypothetical protein